MNIYTVDNRILVTFTVVDEAGAGIDPVEVVFKVKNPDGSIEDLSGNVVKQAVGSYSAEYLPTAVGVYEYEWIGTGVADVAVVDKFLVDEAIF